MPTYAARGAGGTLADVVVEADGTLAQAVSVTSTVAQAAATATAAATAMALVTLKTIEAGNEYETVAVSQTDQILGATGAVGDYLARVVIVVATAATATVSIKDGNGAAINIFPAVPGGGVGTYVVELGIKCVNATTPGWKLTTGAGNTAIGIGDFT